MIEGVKIIPKKQIIDERGKIMHMMRNDDPNFTKFGEIYFSYSHPNLSLIHISEPTRPY